MTESRKGIRTLLAIFGVVVLLATTVITLGTARPTEAQWADEIYGASAFNAVQHPDEAKTFARHAGVFGEVIRVAGNSSTLGPGPTTVAPPSPITRVADPRWVSEDAGTFFRAGGEHFNCARRDNTPADSCAATGHEDPEAKSFAVAQVQDFRARIMALIFPVRLVALGQDRPTVATASCTPGRTGEATLTGGQLSLGSTLGSQQFDLPGPGEYADLNRDIFGYDYTGYLHHDYEVKENYARSQLRLYLQASGDLTNLNPWTVHVVLAHAECGTRMDPTPAPSRPGLDDPRGHNLASTRALNSEHSAPAAPAEAESAADYPATEDVDQDEAREEHLGSEIVTNARETTTPSTSAPNAKPTSVSPTTSAPTTPVTPTPPSATAPPSMTVEAPREPENVVAGRWFAVTTREGVELGAARIEDVTRTPDCGVEITLNITTSNEAGPDRWASIDHRDFAEVRPGGSTRPAQRAGSECASSATSGPAELRAGGVHEVVVVIQVSDTAQRVMFRPEGTAGWRFDLPPLPTTTATSTAATASPSPTTPATSQASAPPQNTAVISEP